MIPTFEAESFDPHLDASFGIPMNSSGWFFFGDAALPSAGFTVTNLSRSPENIAAFCNMRGTCEQWIKEGKGAIRWTRLSCRLLAADAVRLQIHALAYNLGNFLRTLATPKPVNDPCAGLDHSAPIID
jgi:hypothetical protein